MGFLDRIKQVFSSQPSERDDGIYFYVRCKRCQDVVRVRLNPQTELQQDYGDGASGFFVRKTVIDQKCFRPIEVYMTFDGSRREESRDVEGGDFVSAEEYAASQRNVSN